ncbi:MAG: D-2-hydroxyacid dehydrogenase [Rikenellaceae bacterium]|nr:D-2-hydroxyacid dehydrogenase [Rikenellaceae bacterium]
MKIVFLDEYSLGGADLSAIKALGNYVGYHETRPEEVVERCADAEVVIVNKVVLGEKEMAALPALRLICVSATGVNNIDLEAAKRHNIEVKNAVGYSTHTVAEATLGSILALQRQVLYYDRYVKDGRYSASGRFVNFDRPTHRLYGKKWGIIGLGNIGRKVADLATAFGCEVAYYSTSGVARQENYERKELNDLLAWADIISVHCPLNSTTNNLIDKEQVALMKRNALIVNVARGGIVNEQAIADALDQGLIAGAAFDVYPTEPMPLTSPLLKVKNADKLLLSPHNGWSAMESIADLVECVVTNIKNYISKD